MQTGKDEFLIKESYITNTEYHIVTIICLTSLKYIITFRYHNNSALKTLVYNMMHAPYLTLRCNVTTFETLLPWEDSAVIVEITQFCMGRSLPIRIWIRMARVPNQSVISLST